VLKVLEGIQANFNKDRAAGKKVSLADLIVLGNSAAVEDAAPPDVQATNAARCDPPLEFALDCILAGPRRRSRLRWT
jgi:hypothetical protein